LRVVMGARMGKAARARRKRAEEPKTQLSSALFD
jgi:hypothetical protein